MDILDAGHPARPVAARALGLTLGLAVAFTVFAWLTTQVAAVRAGSPWQDDPYNGAVSFTLFLVPALVVVAGARASLWRRGVPQPAFRVEQLLRAAVATTVLVACTVGPDLLAVVQGVDRSLWNGGTPWLVAAAAVLGVGAAVVLLVVGRARRVLAAPPPDGDWLDDLVALLPGTRGPVTVVRRHLVACAAGLSLVAALVTVTADTVGEGGTSPLLFLVLVAVGAGGFLAFCLVADPLLRITVPRRRSPARRAARWAAVAGGLALPLSAVLRDQVLAVLGLPGPVGTPGQLAQLVVAGAVLAAGVAFAIGVSLRPARS